MVLEVDLLAVGRDDDVAVHLVHDAELPHQLRARRQRREDEAGKHERGDGRRDGVVLADARRLDEDDGGGRDQHARDGDAARERPSGRISAASDGAVGGSVAVA